MIDALLGPWPPWAAGLGIGLFVVTLAGLTGKPLGVSGGYAATCDWMRGAAKDRWKVAMALGIPVGAFIAALLSGPITLHAEVAAPPPAATESWVLRLIACFAGGLLLGWGARKAGGCTSGHAIMGCAQLTPASFIATAGFMAGGVAATWALYAALGWKGAV